MNTSDIKKMTEKNNNSEKSIIDIELEVLDEVKAKCKCCKNLYDRVYLCYEDTNFKPSNTYAPIKGFDCYRYNSFESADYAWDNDRTELHKLQVRHTMIPICKWVPKIFDKYILNRKLRNIYWGGKICIGKVFNKYK